MALTKLTKNLIDGTFGTEWVSTIQTSNFTAEAGKGYFVDTTSQVLYVNLPVGVVGMEITIQDYAGTFGTNKVILNANGSEKIQGSAYEGRINTNNATAVLIYQDATKGWTSQDVTINIPLTVEYLVVAGGGGGGQGYYGGGGGAGGYLTNYGGTALTLNFNTNYILTVGAGGGGATTQNSVGVNGNNSAFTSSIISVGGGGGASRTYTSSGGTGGSGGGTNYQGTTSGGAATSGQGNTGGGGNARYGAGGGGAGAAGTDGGTSPGYGMPGGDGLASLITGTSIHYAGGGGGGNNVTATGPSLGGGGIGGTSTGGNGTPSTGGGGGGGGGNGNNGGSGGSGIVILRYPSLYTISGLSGTTTTVGSDKVTTFTNVGTGNIQFN